MKAIAHACSPENKYAHARRHRAGTDRPPIGTQDAIERVSHALLPTGQEELHKACPFLP